MYRFAARPRASTTGPTRSTARPSPARSCAATSRRPATSPTEHVPDAPRARRASKFADLLEAVTCERLTRSRRAASAAACCGDRPARPARRLGGAVATSPPSGSPLGGGRRRRGDLGAPAAAVAGRPRPARDRFDGAARVRARCASRSRYGQRPAGLAALRRLAVRLRARCCRTGASSRSPGHPGCATSSARCPGTRPADRASARTTTRIDTPAGFVGANDGAAGTAAVVELARALRASAAPAPARREIRFVLFDGEEAPRRLRRTSSTCGLRGSRPTSGATRDETRAMILLDYIARSSGLRLPREGSSDRGAVGAAARRGRAASASGASSPTPTAADDPRRPHAVPATPAIPAIDLIDFDYPLATRCCDTSTSVSRAQPRRGRETATLIALRRTLTARSGEPAPTLEAMAVAVEKLLLAAPRGYCAGVDRAVQTVERALELYGAPVYVRKEIVHNKHVVEQLRERGAIFVDELDDDDPRGRDDGLLRPRRVAGGARATPQRRGLQTIDATCPLVTKVHVEAMKFAAEGYTIVLIGHAGHEEVEGTMGEAPEHIVLVETEADVDAPRGRGSRAHRLHLADDAVGRRDARDHQPAARAVPAHHRAAHRRHLLRHDQPPGGRQADGRRSATSCSSSARRTRRTRSASSRSRATTAPTRT